MRPSFIISRAPAYLAPQIRPAGQIPSSYVNGSPPPAQAVGTDSHGFYVDNNHNVLDSSGNIAGPPGSQPGNGMMSTDLPNTVLGGAGPLPGVPGATAAPVTTPSPVTPGQPSTGASSIDLMNPSQNPKAPLLLSGTGYVSAGTMVGSTPSGPSKTVLIVGGIAAVGILGALIYFATREPHAGHEAH